MFLEKMRRFFSIFPVMSTSKAMKMAKTEFPEKILADLDFSAAVFTGIQSYLSTRGAL